MKQQQRIAVIAGASGLIGRHCLQFLLENDAYSQVHALARKPLPIDHPKLTVHLINFNQLRYWEFPEGADVFCCLGAPMRNIRNHYLLYRVDLEYPRTLAQIAHKAGSKRFLIITSAGIGPRSPIYYCRVKVRLEETLKSMGWPQLNIFRPSFLIDRPGPEDRFQWLTGLLLRPFTPLFAGFLNPYRPISAKAAGFAMVHCALQDQSGSALIQSGQMHRIHHIHHSQSTQPLQPHPLKSD